mmetsp:Transcript_2906/g.7923  ORF Transcript_2906/g.7923 Transcript_2906/m.7923 type:complete len:251 (-) Transcript_2906:351-1103(-)
MPCRAVPCRAKKTYRSVLRSSIVLQRHGPRSPLVPAKVEPGVVGSSPCVSPPATLWFRHRCGRRNAHRILLFGDGGGLKAVVEPVAKEFLSERVQPQHARAQQQNVGQVLRGERLGLKDLLEGRKVRHQELADKGSPHGPQKGGVSRQVHFVKALFGGPADVGIEEIAVDKDHKGHGRVPAVDRPVVELVGKDLECQVDDEYGARHGPQQECLRNNGVVRLAGFGVEDAVVDWFDAQALCGRPVHDNVDP